MNMEKENLDIHEDNVNKENKVNKDNLEDSCCTLSTGDFPMMAG